MEQKNRDEHVKELTEKRVVELLETDVSKVNKRTFTAQLAQAKIGIIYVRDREIMKRIGRGHIIRVINLISSTPEEKKEYVRASMPEIEVTAIE